MEYMEMVVGMVASLSPSLSLPPPLLLLLIVHHAPLNKNHFRRRKFR